MRFLPILLSFGALAAARCGTAPASESQKAYHNYLHEKEAREAHQPATRDVFNIEVDTYIHIVNGNSTGNHENFPERVHEQVKVLNHHYKPTGFSFNLVNVSYTHNPKWLDIHDGDDKELEMKSALRRGNFKSVNIYFVDLEDDLLGIATFPTDKGPNQFKLDGVMCDLATLPGGKKPYDLGITAVHEVGHWLNLLHTFNPENEDDESPTAGCFGHGDFVHDTPAEGSSAEGCPARRDTCSGVNETSNHFSAPGLDPVHNFMDYTDDRCLTEFTPGQIVRMQNSWEKREHYTPGVAGRRARPDSGWTN